MLCKPISSEKQLRVSTSVSVLSSASFRGALSLTIQGSACHALVGPLRVRSPTYLIPRPRAVRSPEVSLAHDPPTRTTRTTLARGAAPAGAWRTGAARVRRGERPSRGPVYFRRAFGVRRSVIARIAWGSRPPRLLRTRHTEARVRLTSSVSHGQGVWRPSIPVSGRFIRTLPTDDSE